MPPPWSSSPLTALNATLISASRKLLFSATQRLNTVLTLAVVWARTNPFFDTAPSKKGFVLAQTTANVKTVFNLCVAEKSSFRDAEISVAFKAVKGDEDQGGGIVWRYQDANNYYIARM